MTPETKSVLTLVASYVVIGLVGSVLELIGEKLQFQELYRFGRQLEAIGADWPKLLNGKPVPPAVLPLIAWLFLSCTPSPCSPEERTQLTAIYLAEAEPIIAAGKCKGYDVDECPALADVNARHRARRQAFVECERGTP